MFLEDTGIVDINSPKAMLKDVYAQKLIGDEKNWLLMLNDRNMTSHIYKEEIAVEIAERISGCYIKVFGFRICIKNVKQSHSRKRLVKRSRRNDF